MRLFLSLSLLCSLLGLPCALEVPGFQPSLTDDPTEDIFPFEERFDDTFALQGTSDDISDSSFLLASDCSAFSPLNGRKRARRGDSPDLCSAEKPLTGSTDEDGQKIKNGILGVGGGDDTIDPNIQLDDQLQIPSLATYSNERNDDCFRLTNGELPLAVCDLGGGADPEYMLNGRVYRDLEFSYPSKEMPYFPVYLFLLAHFLCLGVQPTSITQSD